MKNFMCFECSDEIESSAEMHPWTLRPDKPTVYFHFECYVHFVNKSISEQEYFDAWVEGEALKRESELIKLVSNFKEPS